MKPTWTRRWPRACSASITRSAEAASGVSGFSHRTGRSCSNAARRAASWAGPGEAISTASTPGAAIAAAGSVWAVQPSMSAATAAARSASTSATAATRAPPIVRSIRRTWSAPMRPVPMTAMPRGSRRFMAYRLPVGSSGAAGAEELAGADGDRERLVRFAGVHVLLDDGEQVHAQLLRGHQDGLQLGHAAGRFAHDAALHGRPEGDLVLDDVGEDVRVDLLEVQVADAFAVGIDQLDAVAAAVGVVAGVEAEVDHVGVGGVEEALDVLLGVDVGVGVRVDHDVEAVGVADLAAQAFHAGAQVAPLLGGEFGCLQDLGGLVVAPEGGDDDEVLGTHVAGEGGHPADLLPGGVPLGRPAVQPAEDGAGGDLQAAALHLVVEAGGVGGEVAVGAEFDPGVAGLGDLVEEALPGHLLRVVGEPHAPGVGGGTDPDAVERDCHVRTFLPVLRRRGTGRRRPRAVPRCRRRGPAPARA